MGANKVVCRYTLDLRWRHPVWSGKLVNFRRYGSDNKDEMTKKIIELSKCFSVPTSAMVLHDSQMRMEYVYEDGQYVPADRAKPVDDYFTSSLKGGLK